jgi:gamma-glutamyl-gamma-aminobutyrate hydrolase PuuD
MPTVTKIGTNGYRVYVVEGGLEYIQLLYQLGYQGAKGLGDCDFVLFTGGADVTPDLYGEKRLSSTHCNEIRDEREKIIYEEALAAGIPMVGICRGGQFLNVMNGGKMWQHVTDHCGNHLATELVPQRSKEGPRSIMVTSTHHQMMIPHETGQVLMAAGRCKRREGYELVKTGVEENSDVEVVWYGDTNCLCFQPHPEFPYAPKDCKDYFDELLDNYIIPALYNVNKKKGAA